MLKKIKKLRPTVSNHIISRSPKFPQTVTKSSAHATAAHNANASQLFKEMKKPNKLDLELPILKYICACRGRNSYNSNNIRMRQGRKAVCDFFGVDSELLVGFRPTRLSTLCACRLPKAKQVLFDLLLPHKSLKATDILYKMPKKIKMQKYKTEYTK